MANVDVGAIQVLGSCFDQSNKPSTGKKCSILLKWSDAKLKREELKRSVKFVFDGPCKPEMLWSSVAEADAKDDCCATAYFVPTKAGVYQLTVKFMGKKLRPEPFKIEVVGDDLDVSNLLSKVSSGVFWCFEFSGGERI